jgi:hypothetical protein
MTRYLPVGWGALDHDALRLGADLVAAELAPADEELLVGRPSVDGAAGGFGLRFLQAEVGDLRAGQIAGRFAEDKLAVVMDAGLEVLVELVDDAGGSPKRWRSSSVQQFFRRASNCAP